MYDCHLHSTFSTDSSMDAEAACVAAIKAGLEGLTFTDHLDIDFPYETFNIDFDIYTNYLDKLKAKYKGRLNILKGVEVGIMPHVVEDTLKITKSYEFDFIVASVHIINGLDPYTKKYYEGKSKFEAYSSYIEAVIRMLDMFKDFDSVGHIDFVIRKARYEDRTFRYDSFKELLDQFFAQIIEMGKGFELNTGSYRDIPGKLTSPDYDINILKRYKQMGGEIITIGSDSHSVDYIGYKFEYFRQLLLEAGFKYITRFEERKPIFDKL